MSDQIERCAVVADQMVSELEAILQSPQGRKGQYDRQTPLQIRYAIRWVRKLGVRIRALKPPHEEMISETGDGDHFKEAQELLRELRPMVAKAGTSHWRAVMLQKIDGLLK